jgi:hypothetical protein
MTRDLCAYVREGRRRVSGEQVVKHDRRRGLAEIFNVAVDQDGD